MPSSIGRPRTRRRGSEKSISAWEQKSSTPSAGTMARAPSPPSPVRHTPRPWHIGARHWAIAWSTFCTNGAAAATAAAAARVVHGPAWRYTVTRVVQPGVRLFGIRVIGCPWSIFYKKKIVIFILWLFLGGGGTFVPAAAVAAIVAAVAAVITAPPWHHLISGG